jgi:hypothetical protein
MLIKRVAENIIHLKKKMSPMILDKPRNQDMVMVQREVDMAEDMVEDMDQKKEDMVEDMDLRRVVMVVMVLRRVDMVVMVLKKAAMVVMVLKKAVMVVVISMVHLAVVISMDHPRLMHRFLLTPPLSLTQRSYRKLLSSKTKKYRPNKLAKWIF